MLVRLRSLLPPSARGVLHEAAGPLVILLTVYGFTTETQAVAVVAAVVAVTDLLLAALHAESTFRTLIYPALAAVSAALVNFGVYDQHLAAAVLGVAAAVLGHAVAARHTPYVGRHRAVG